MTMKGRCVITHAFNTIYIFFKYVSNAGIVSLFLLFSNAANTIIQSHEVIDWSSNPDTSKAMAAFRDEVIHPHIFQQVNYFYTKKQFVT